MPEIVPLTVLGNPFPNHVWDASHPDVYLFYEGPLLWKHTTRDGFVGFVHWADRVERPLSDHSVTQFDVYHFYAMPDFDVALAATRAGKPLVQVFKEASFVYRFRTLSNDIMVREIDLLPVQDVDPATMPSPDANLKEE